MTYPAYGPTVEAARAFIRARATRIAAFGDDADMFGDAAWVILLQLYTAHADGTVDSLVTKPLPDGSTLRATARWLRLLEARGLVRRDAHRITLTPRGVDRVEAALS